MNSHAGFAPRARQNFGRFQNGRRFASNGKRGGNRKDIGREHIDVSRFIKQATAPAKITASNPITHAFADFGFNATLAGNIARLGFTVPTPVQDQTIMPALEGRDIVGLANTGSGKTGAYLLPLINNIAKNRKLRVLVIAPTRELAVQINDDFRRFSRGMGLDSAILVGGIPPRPQRLQLRNNPNFIIGTPGRLKDFQQQNVVNFIHFTTVVLDEVDRMLDMGFIEDIKHLMSKVPAAHQTLFFSATMPERARRVADQFLKNPMTFEILSNRSADNVEQNLIRAGQGQEKFDELKKLLDNPGMEKVIIFGDTKHGVEKLSKNLQRDGYKAESIHGGKRQNQRQKTLSLFRENKINVLVATDVAARGLDIKDVTHVINYTVPRTYDDYIHRIGRTGRANAKGCAYTFA
ncbi:MAG: DEAD/DEAH box helicase [Candidatus Pacebacteria bacterium]|jgi:superfamily II DNA/RNA helicase|nr:DEAD/DEAH box helicase [Candidatus Paceibacterota bacterium]